MDDLPDQVIFKREISLAVNRNLAQLARIKSVAAFLAQEFKREPNLFN